MDYWIVQIQRINTHGVIAVDKTRCHDMGFARKELAEELRARRNDKTYFIRRYGKRAFYAARHASPSGCYEVLSIVARWQPEQPQRYRNRTPGALHVVSA